MALTRCWTSTPTCRNWCWHDRPVLRLSSGKASLGIRSRCVVPSREVAAVATQAQIVSNFHFSSDPYNWTSGPLYLVELTTIDPAGDNEPLILNRGTSAEHVLGIDRLTRWVWNRWQAYSNGWRP